MFFAIFCGDFLLSLSIHDHFSYGQMLQSRQVIRLEFPPMAIMPLAHVCASSSMTRTELVVVLPDTGRQQCARLSAANGRSAARCQLKLYQKRYMIRRNLRVRTAVNMVLLKPRPIWRSKNTKRPHEIPSIEDVIDNASEVKPEYQQ